MNNIINLIEQGQFDVAAFELIGLYNSKTYKEEAWAILRDVYISPNLEIIEHNYEHNRQCIFQAWPQYTLPYYPVLDYQLIPIDEGIFALWDREKDFIIDAKHLNRVQIWYFKLFTDELTQADLSDDDLFLLVKAHKLYQNKSKALYNHILGEIAKSKFKDESSIIYLEEYYSLSHDDEGYGYALACHLYQTGAFQKAKDVLLDLRKKNVLNLRISILLAKVYEKIGDKLAEGKVLIDSFMLVNNSNNSLPENEVKQVRVLFSTWINEADKTIRDEVFAEPMEVFFFPRYATLALKNDGLNMEYRNFYAKYLGQSNQPYNLFVALTGNGYEGSHLALAQLLDSSHSPSMYFHLKTELVAAKTRNKVDLGEVGKKMVVPLCGLSQRQEVYLQDKTGIKKAHTRNLEFTYCEIEGKTNISSGQDFIVGKPILLDHQKERKKLVLNVLMDAGDYEFIRKTNFDHCPNIKGFFNKGVIFEHNFCVAEHTIPALSSMFTGKCQKKHQIFNNKTKLKLSDNISTVTEKFSENGYYTALFTSHSHIHFNKVSKGFDRIIEQFAYYYLIQDIVQDTIEHIRAFRETDNFIWVSFLDLHRVLEDVKLPLAVQTKHQLHETDFEDRQNKSVFKKKNSVRFDAYGELMENVDFQLGLLFRCIEQLYQEDEFVVSLCADHGVSFLDDDLRLLKHSYTNTCAMYRGANVPALGIVDSEVVSALDLYPTLCHMADIAYDESQIDGRLPKVFGGDGHEFVISESLYPGQTYKLCIRNLEYEYFLETAAFTSYDGKVDMSKYQVELFNRKSHQKVRDKALEKMFLDEAYKYLRTHGQLTM